MQSVMNSVFRFTVSMKMLDAWQTHFLQIEVGYV